MTDSNGTFLTVLDAMPTRCTIIMEQSLQGFHLANAVAVIAMTVGKRHPGLLGDALTDADGFPHPGLIPSGVPILQADQSALHAIREQALEKGMDVVDFTEEGQSTRDYEEYQTMMSAVGADDLHYLGIAVIGSKSAVGRLTKRCEMMR